MILNLFFSIRKYVFSMGASGIIDDTDDLSNDSQRKRTVTTFFM